MTNNTSEVCSREKTLRLRGHLVSSDQRVLLVENDEVSQKLTKLMLLKNGVQVDVVADSNAALLALSQYKYNLILMDLILPDVSGLVLTGMIRAIKGCQEVWIVALTACAMPGDRKRCLESGMDGYLSKPFKEKELIDLIWKFNRMS